MPTPPKNHPEPCLRHCKTLPVTTVLRSEVLPELVLAEGLLILRNGEPGDPEVTLSPLRYHYQHRAETEVVVQGPGRDAAFDTLTTGIGHCARSRPDARRPLRLGRSRSTTPGSSPRPSSQLGPSGAVQ